MLIQEAKNHFTLINGRWCESESKNWVEISSTSDRGVVGRVPAMTQAEVDIAMQGSVEAQKSWAKLPVHERGRILHNWADQLVAMADSIADVLMKEVGKKRAAAKDEVIRTADLIRYNVEEGKRLHGELMKGDSYNGGSAKKIAMIDKAPLGLILAISPFNYPINLSASKIAPALITGNAVILKPATQGSISALMMVEALMKAGLPDGVLNVITGRGSEIGELIQCLMRCFGYVRVAGDGNPQLGRIMTGGEMLVSCKHVRNFPFQVTRSF
jgi:glyceraldehyde-3-phosphate dehydrogenase (NADP+)